MNPVIDIVAREVAKQINLAVNLPFLNEEQEEIFFRLVVTKVLEVTVGHLLSFLEKPKPETTKA